jgi:uncharacterized protein DUF4304
MTKSAFAQHLDLLQTQVTGVLRPLGFKKAGRTYNRASADGLMQVVNLQITRPDPAPPQLRAKGERTAPSDRFTVNLGIWIPEVADYHLTHPRSKTIQEYDCQVRTRVGSLTTSQADLWWPLGTRWPDSAAEVVRLLRELGLPWLDRFGTRDGVLAGWVAQAPDARIVRAIIHARRGHHDEARTLLAEQIATTRQPAHRAYVQVVANDLGLGILPTN